MKKLIASAFVSLVFCSTFISAQEVVFSNWANRDTVFLLSGELFTNVYNIQTTSTDSSGYILSYLFRCYDGTLYNANAVKGTVENSGVDLDGESYMGKESGFSYVKFLPSSSSTAAPTRIASLLNFVSSGILARYFMSYDVEVMFKNKHWGFASGRENFCFHDRYRGDISGDNKVDGADVELAARYIDACFPNSMPVQYTKDGTNMGAIILPGQTMPTTLIGPTLLNIWVNDHSDPIVQNLGFGELISQFNLQHGLAKKAVSAPQYTTEIVGNKLTVKTHPNSAVNIYSFIGPKLWRKDAFADANGQWTVSIPDPTAKYTVEVCELGGSINPTTVYQKPAVKNTSSFQKFSGSNTVYSLDGRRIANMNHSAIRLNIVRLQNGTMVKSISNSNR